MSINRVAMNISLLSNQHVKKEHRQYDAAHKFTVASISTD